jgi:hypothetical protein
MNRLLFALVLAVAGVVGLGFYMGWFRVGTDSSDGATHITFTVNSGQIQADENRALEKARDVGQPAPDAQPSRVP